MFYNDLVKNFRYIITGVVILAIIVIGYLVFTNKKPLPKTDKPPTIVEDVSPSPIASEPVPFYPSGEKE